MLRRATTSATTRAKSLVSQDDKRRAGSAGSVRGVLRMRGPDPSYELGLCPRSGDVKEREPMREPGV